MFTSWINFSLGYKLLAVSNEEEHAGKVDSVEDEDTDRNASIDPPTASMLQLNDLLL